jgi:hypothetical protein
MNKAEVKYKFVHLATVRPCMHLLEMVSRYEKIPLGERGGSLV